MKPNAPAEIHGEFKPVATTVPGIDYCEHQPTLAKHAHRLALLTPWSNEHNESHTLMLTGRSLLPRPEVLEESVGRNVAAR